MTIPYYGTNGSLDPSWNLICPYFEVHTPHLPPSSRHPAHLSDPPANPGYPDISHIKTKGV